MRPIPPVTRDLFPLWLTLTRDLFPLLQVFERPSDLPRLADAIWNVRTDNSLIDFDVGGGGISGRHNGYITTIPTRLLLEILYEQ